MNISQKNISLIAALAIILLTIGKMKFFSYYPDNTFDVSSYSVEPSKLDSLEDGIRMASSELDKLKREKILLTNGFYSFSGYTFPYLGVVNVDFEKGHPDFNKDWLLLTSIGLRFDDNQINGKTYMAYQIKEGQPNLVTKKLIKNKNGHSVINVYKKVDYKYSSRENSIILPLESTFWRICVFGLSLLEMLLTVAIHLFVLFTFFNFLLAVAKNRAFDEGNIQRLRDMSIGFFVLALSPFLINSSIYVLFILKHSAEGVIITKSFFDYDYYLLIIAILSYLLYTAFKKAMILQKEQDLTI